MLGNHVSNLSSAYWHDELTPQESRRVAEHLIGCHQCRTEFEEVKLGARFAAQLERLPAPDFLWTRVAAGLDGYTSSRRRLRFLKPLAIASGLVVLIAAGSLLLRRVPSRPAAPSTIVPAPTSGWQVARIGGSPRINSQSITNQGKLGVGQWLETDAASRARVEVADIGRVDVDPNTRVRLLQTSDHEHRLELQRGRLSALISAPPKIFFVNTPSGVAADLGCAYTLEVDDKGNSRLRVTLGWVALQLKDRESVVPSGAECVTRPGVGPGTPYFEDASDAFRNSLSEFDFPTDPSLRSSSLETISREARPRDAMTLFYLLPQVTGTERAALYDRMTALVRAPKGVKREGMLNLNPEMMQLWKEELGLTWGQTFDKAASTWKKVWTASLGKFNRLQGKR